MSNSWNREPDKAVAGYSNAFNDDEMAYYEGLAAHKNNRRRQLDGDFGMLRKGRMGRSKSAPDEDFVGRAARDGRGGGRTRG